MCVGVPPAIELKSNGKRERIRGGNCCNLLTRANGEPVRDFRGAWDALTHTAQVDGLLFHDLRRSAVRNLVRRGVSEQVAMRISGHKSRSVFERYNIVSESDLADAALKIERGAKAELARAVGHGLDIVAPNQGSPELAPKAQKPS